MEAAGRTVSLQHEWKQDLLHFAAGIQGVKVTGTVQVLPEEVQLQVRLPLIAMPFSGWINRVMKVAISGNFPGGQPVVDRSLPTDPTTIPTASVLLFLHIPKAAGTTLGEYVFAQCRHAAARPEITDAGMFREGVYYAPFGFFKTETRLTPEYALPYLQHSSLRAVIGHFSYGLHEHIPRPARYFTMLRHPADRILSLYYFLKENENISLEAFLERDTYLELDNDQTRRIAGVHPAFGEVNKEHFDLALRHLQENFLLAGLSDRFDESVLLLKQALEWQEDFVYHPRNVTTGRPKVRSLSPALQQKILELNAWDLKLYEAAADLLNEKINAYGPTFKNDLAAYRQQLQNH